jgi:hypothetical protein
MWNSIRRKYPTLNETFYGLSLHDDSSDYYTVDGVQFARCNWLDRSIGPQIAIKYYEKNTRLQRALMDYARSAYGELEDWTVQGCGLHVASKDRKFDMSGLPRAVNGSPEVELRPYTVKNEGMYEDRPRYEYRDMTPHVAATKLSDLIYFLLSSVRS